MVWIIWVFLIVNLGLSVYFFRYLRKKLKKQIKKLHSIIDIKNAQILDKITQNIKEYSMTLGEEQGDFVKRNNTGKNSYICEYFVCASTDTTIGKFCSIAANVTLGTTFHPKDRLSTHPFTYFEPFKLSPKSKQCDFIYRKPVTVGNDVWIGKHVTIMDGITIGDGAIIGTNAVVTHDVPPYAIVVGVPARVLRYRFDKQTIDDLLRLKWWDLDDETIAQLPFCDIKKCIEELKKIRGRK